MKVLVYMFHVGQWRVLHGHLGELVREPVLRPTQSISYYGLCPAREVPSLHEALKTTVYLPQVNEKVLFVLYSLLTMA